MRISFERLWTDDDQMVELAVAASNDRQTGSMQIFIYPEQLREFGDRLQAFPSSMRDEVELEAGKRDQGWYGYFRMRAYVASPAEVALEISMETYEAPPRDFSSHFYIVTEAELNRLGRAISGWDPLGEARLVYPDDAT